MKIWGFVQATVAVLVWTAATLLAALLAVASWDVGQRLAAGAYLLVGLWSAIRLKWVVER